MKARFDFTGSSVLVTGASRGIGLGIARAFADAGAGLTILADSHDIHDAARDLPGDVRALVCDISDPAAVEQALAGLGRIDVLVNNAGMERPTPLDGGRDAADTARRILSVNVSGTENVTRAALPLMPDGARIVLTSSIWGKTAVPRFSGYVASKHAIIGLARTWAAELGPRGITVNAVCPGWVRTGAAEASLRDMAQTSGRSEDALLDEIMAGQAIGGLMEPADVAGTYLFLASDAAENITGQALTVDRGEILA
ncbi:SDR family NAD(P)-dependent oxidoreductase [Brevirhabdus sp.]|uniref:SDR family NAD(P)-dependent oxidoreductase n=1 Tax=Brevirhabdus sp. TaxID=2004514 RepID=UPI004058EA5D